MSLTKEEASKVFRDILVEKDTKDAKEDSNTKTDEPPPRNWKLIGGIAVVVVIIGVIWWYYSSKTVEKTTEKTTEKSIEKSGEKKDVETDSTVKLSTRKIAEKTKINSQ